MNPEIFKLSLSIFGILHNSTTPHPPTTKPPDPDPKPINRGVEGVYYTTIYNRTIEAYYGIPYAEPPVSERRFLPPKPIEMYWEMVANQSRPICIHQNPMILNDNIGIGDDDCLYMNIFRPLQNETKKKLPVIVYLHGTENEFYLQTDGIYYPDYLMLGDIIFVTVSYRMGIIGFLSTGDSVIPGNRGFKDQNVALQWINKNIYYFDGDPNQVTLIGNGFGAASIQYHMMSPLSIGLFQKAILLSGSAIARFLDVNDDPKAQAQMVVEYCEKKKFDNLTSNEIYAFLSYCLPKTMFESSKLFKDWGNFPWEIYRPVVENDDDILPFLTGRPRELWLNGDFSTNISVILSITEQEGLYQAGQILGNQTYMKDLDKNLAEHVLEMFDVRFVSKEERQEKLNYIFGAYWISPADKYKEKLIDMFSDRYYLQPLYETAEGLTLYSSEVYLTQFAYKGENTLDKYYTNYTLANNQSYGAVHGDDRLYFINWKDLNGNDIVADEDEEFRLNYVTSLLMYVIGDYNGDSLFHQCTCTDIINQVCDVNIFTKDGVKYKSILDLGIEKIRVWKSIDRLHGLDDEESIDK